MIPEPARAPLIFLLAALFEIGGGYLVWRAVREDASVLVGASGLLVVAGLPLTLALLDAPFFGRAYAAYGGVFVVASLAWGWLVDRVRADSFDVAGGAVILAGVALIYFAPR